jgi:hypothetical protein
MVTSTFDKRIIIDNAATDILIALLKEPPPPRPEPNENFHWTTAEDWECFMQRRSERLSEQSGSKQ